MKNRRRVALICSAALLMLVISDGARAQQVGAQDQVQAAPQPQAGTGAGQPDAAGRSQARDTGAGDIIVTAQRRAQRLEDVPMSITAVSAETIAKSGITNITELGAIAPGVQVNFAGGATQPAIRGITSLTNFVGAENNVAIYIDGFYVPDMSSINADFANVQNIEVLKGPQGTLYGRNATGGAILITTKAPSSSFTGRLEGSYATFDDRSISGYLSGPISPGLRFSVAGYDRKSDGYIKFSDPLQVGGPSDGDAAPIRQRNLRARLEADLASNLTASIGYNYALSDDPRGNLFTTYAHIPPTVAAPPLRATDYFERSYNFDTKNLATTNEGTLKVAYRSGIGTITSYTSYGQRRTAQDFDFDGTYADTGSNQQTFIEKTFQQGLDLVVNKVRNLDLVLGANYYTDVTRTEGPTERLTLGPGQVPLSSIIMSLGSHAYALYADATYHVSSALSVDLGGRYSHERKTIAIQVTGSGAYPELDKEATFSKFTPRASIRYELAPRTSIYASYAQGFRSGTFPTSGAVATIQPIRPETVKSYEVGFKTASRLVRFDVAAFYYDDRDLHVSLTVPVCVGAVCSTQVRIANAPRAKSYGVDGQLTLTPAERLSIRVGAAYLHARYTDFTNATGTGLNTTTDRNVSNQLQDWSGQQMARSPTFSGNVGVDYTVNVFGGGLLLAANLNYTDSYVINNPSLFGPLAGPALANRQRYRQGAYTLLNLQASWSDPSKHWSVGVFAHNVTDKRYLMTDTGGANGDYFTPAFPRQIGGRVSYQF